MIPDMLGILSCLEMIDMLISDMFLSMLVSVLFDDDFEYGCPL